MRAGSPRRPSASGEKHSPSIPAANGHGPTSSNSVRAPRSGLRRPGVAVAPVPAGDPADAAQPEEESSGGPASPPRGPARFSLSPEKARGSAPPGSPVLRPEGGPPRRDGGSRHRRNRMGPAGGPDRQECEPGLDRAPRRSGGLRGTRRLARRGPAHREAARRAGGPGACVSGFLGEGHGPGASVAGVRRSREACLAHGRHPATGLGGHALGNDPGGAVDGPAIGVADLSRRHGPSCGR